MGTPSATGLSLPVSGTVAQVQSAFSTPISKYRLSSGKTGYDNATAPEVDTTVAPQIEGILGLDTLSQPQPSTSVPEASRAVPDRTAALAAPTLSQGQPQPAAGSCSTAITDVEDSTGALDAPDLAQAYSFDPLYSSNHYGAGSTVALLEMSGAGYSTNDIDTFAACYGITLGTGQIKQVTVGGGGATGGGTAESELDIETVLAMAPKADIEVYEGGPSDGLYNVFSKIVNDDSAKIVSASWTNGCEAYVGQSTQNSENTLFQTAAAEGQSIFVASGDQGAQGCNINGEIDASTGSTSSDPVAQAVDPSTGTLYIADKSSNDVSVDSEGSTSNPSDFVAAGSVSTGSGSGPDAVALAAGKVFVANDSNSSLTLISTSTCNQSTTSGCSSPTQIASGGHLSSPTALAVSGSTLYVGNANGSVAVYSIGATTVTYVTTVALASGSVLTALAVDSTNDVVYVADGANSRIEYFSSTTCNATTTTGCSATPTTVTVGHDPVAVTVASSAGNLYVANAGSGGGITVVSLSTQAVVTTISTMQTGNGTGVVQSIGLSPSGNQVLAVLNGLDFPGDVMATINPSTESITATVALETGSDSMGQLVSDSTLDYVWVTDETNGGDVIQNLNLAVSDPASQPYVTSVGGTSLGHGAAQSFGPPPAETAWNDALYYSEGAGGGGISETFAMPDYQQALGVISGSSGTPCTNTGGDCREVPDVSADADPSSGYIVYDTVDGFGGWNALGGTSGATPLWAAVLAVVASADGNTAGYGALNPALYLLAQRSPGTYLNDVTSGTNDYNATAGGEYPAVTGYDMATGLGTPVASELESGLTTIPLTVVVSGTQAYGGPPTFSATANYAGSGTAPYDVTLNTSGLICTTVGSSTAIGPSLAVGQYTVLASSCSGLTFSGADGPDYSPVYTSTANDFTVTTGPIDVAVSGSQVYGGTPTFGGTDSPPPGVTVSTSGVSCTQVGSTTIATSLPAGSYTLATSTCGGATLSGPDESDYTVAYTSAAGDFAVTKAPLTVTASSTSMTYGATVPTITAAYSGFVNGDTVASLTTRPSCSTTVTSASPVMGSPYATSCGGAVDPNYAFSYFGGSVTVNTAPLTITAASPSMTYGGTVPTISALYTGFKNGDTGSSMSTPPGCSTTATSSSTVAGSPYQTFCSGAADSNYTIGYATGDLTVGKAQLTVTALSTSMTYGGTVPTITPNYSGFVNGDSQTSLTTQPSCSSTAMSSSTVAGSPYPSSCTGAADPNYTVVSVNGAVTVTKAPLTITASSGSMPYGGAQPTITPGYSGFVNGDTSLSLTTNPTCSTTANGSSPVSGSPYTASCSGAVDSNYAITYVRGSVTVTPVPLTITASSTSMTYGAPKPTITPAYSGFVNGDSSSSLTTKPTCTTAATSSSAVSGSPYASSCSGAVDSNYTIAYVNGSVTLNTAPLTITPQASTMTYGGTVPTITPNYSGFVPGDSQSSLTTQPSCSTTATSSSTVAGSPYLSSCTGAADPNYTIVYDPGATTVTPAPIPVAVSGSQANAGAPNFAGTATQPPPSGVTVDTTGVTCSQVLPSTNISGALSSGSYTLLAGSCSGAALSGPDASDYTATYTSATDDFTVTGGPAAPATPPPPPTTTPGATPAPTYGYWLVGSDGGIFTFGSAQFYGSTGSIRLQRPVVGISPTANKGGYWLVASDGGIFAFGDAGYFGSIPGDGLSPAGSGLPHSLNAPIVAMVPSSDGGGYFMVASDGGVFAFGDARFAGSCPGIGGCSGAAVAVVPDASGNGYWLVTQTGNVYGFGDARFYGAPGNQGSAVTSAVRTADGGGYWVLLADGAVYAYGDAVPRGGPVGSVGGLNPASTIFSDADGGGYWVASADGAVFPYGDAPNDGSMAGSHLNGSIIAATGF